MKFRVKIGWSKKDDAERHELGQHAHDKIDGNPYFGTPKPSMADLQTSVDEYKTAYEDALALGKPLKAILKEKRDAFKIMIDAVADYVNSIAQGSSVIITSAGFDTNSAPVSHLMTQVVNVQTYQGLHSGEILLDWDAVDGARLYLGYIRAAGDAETKFELKLKAGGTRGVINGLEPGKEYEVVIEACGGGINNVGKLSEIVHVHAAF